MQLINQIVTLLNKLLELLGHFVGKSEKAQADKDQAQYQQNITDIENDPASFGKDHFGSSKGDSDA